MSGNQLHAHRNKPNHHNSASHRWSCWRLRWALAMVLVVVIWTRSTTTFLPEVEIDSLAVVVDPEYRWPPPQCHRIPALSSSSSSSPCDDSSTTTTTASATGHHTFDCHVNVCWDQLLDEQLVRYQQHNLHEPVETKLFSAIIRHAAAQEPHYNRDLFVDVGAAIGYYMILSVQLNPYIDAYGFNPSASFQHHVATNVALNQLQQQPQQHPFGDHLCLDYRALTDTDHTRVFIGEHYGDGAESQAAGSKSTKKSGNWAETVRFDTFLRELLPRIPFIVMLDIQGMEVAVLQTMQEAGILAAGTIPIFFVGIHGYNYDKVQTLLDHSQSYDLLIAERTVPFQPDGMILAVAKRHERRPLIGQVVQIAQQHLHLPYDDFLRAVEASMMAAAAAPPPDEGGRRDT
jgi:FkbM family methyltransferase